ncbi:hypothetical protein V8J36_16255 [Frigidibacter sp. MR17.14]|uniref:hypothetical protein n=1 Tax=Frigidibacter sp. MR17.14 TaxID=3126509 RepID=UPI003013171A
MNLRALGLVLVALLTLAFGAAGHAHHVPEAADLRLQAYVLAGGSVADLCDDSATTHAKAAGCPVCHLIGAAVVPQPLGTPQDIELRHVATLVAPRVARAEGRARDPAIPPRGPPPSA